MTKTFIRQSARDHATQSHAHHAMTIADTQLTSAQIYKYNRLAMVIRRAQLRKTAIPAPTGAETRYEFHIVATDGNHNFARQSGGVIAVNADAAIAKVVALCLAELNVAFVNILELSVEPATVRSTPVQDARDHAALWQRIYETDAARYGHTERVNRLQYRAMKARTRAVDLETLEIDEAACEIGVNRDVMRYQDEIKYCQSQLVNADLLSAARCCDLRERLSVAREDLALTKWELMQ